MKNKLQLKKPHFSFSIPKPFSSKSSLHNDTPYTMDSLPLPQQNTVNEFIAITGIETDDTQVQKAIALLSHHDYNLNNAVLAFFEQGLEVPAPPVLEPELGADPRIQEFAEGQVNEFGQFDQFGPFSTGIERFEPTPVQHRNLQNEFVMNQLFPNLMKAARIPNRWVSDLGTYMAQKGISEDLEPLEPLEKQDKQEALKVLKVVEKQLEDMKKLTKSPIWWMILLIFPKAISFILTALRYIFRLNTVPYDSHPSKFDYSTYDPSYCIVKDIQDLANRACYDVESKNFNETHEHCQKEYSFLITILVNDKTVEFINMLLSDSKFSALFDKSRGEFKDCRLYIGNIDKSPEALEIAQVYKYRKVPFVFAAANVTRNPAVMSSMSLIYKANCHYGDEQGEKTLLVAKVIKAIKKSFTEFNPQLVSKRYDKQEMEFSRLLKEKQDEAYLDSLQNDRIKKQEKELKKQAEDLKLDVARRRRAYLGSLVQSEYFVKNANNVTATECVRIAIKLPHGKRLVQKFPIGSPLCDVYLFAELQMLDDSELEELKDLEEVTEVDYDDYVQSIGFRFEMFKPLPKCDIPITTTTIAEFGNLKSGDTLLLEFSIDSDEE